MENISLKKQTYDPIKKPDEIEFISQEEIKKRSEEIIKCISNPVYFSENYYYIRSIDKGTILLPPYKKQKELIKTILEDRFVISLAARQSGKTTAYIAIALYVCFFMEGKEIVILANKEKTAIGILKRIKRAFEWIPKEKSWIKPGVTKWSEKQIEFENGCSITAMASSSDAARSTSCLVGNTTVCIKINHRLYKDIEIKKAYCIINEEKEACPCHLLDNMEPAKLFCSHALDITKIKRHEAKNCLRSNTNARVNEEYLVELFSKKVGYKFERGKHINRYFLDGLYKNIVLEINEPHHAYPSGIDHDMKKYNFLISKGYKLILIWDRLDKFKYSVIENYQKRYGNNIIQYIIPKLSVLTNYGWVAFDGISNNGIRNDIVSINDDLECTSDHLIYTKDGMFKAEDCDEKTTFTYNGVNQMTVKKTDKSETVYDLINVRNPMHSFFVNKGQFLVHNCYLLLIDEAAFIPKNIISELWASVFPTISRSETSKVVLVSTANGIGGLFYDIWQDATIGGNKTWTPVLINWWDIEGRGEAWKQAQIKGFGPNGEKKFAQEFGNEFLGSAPTLLDNCEIKGLTGVMIESKIEPSIWKIGSPKIGQFDITIWKEPLKNHCYILGGDVAEGIGLDYSVSKIFDITDLSNIEEVASFESNTISGTVFGYVLAKMARKYNDAYVACERNGVSATAIDALWRTFEYDSIVDIGSNKYAIGIFSNHSTKLDACLWFRDLIQDSDFNLTLRDGQTILELQRFEKLKAKSVTIYEASSGHDDRVMSLIWAMYSTKSEYIERYYTISSYKKNRFGVEVPARLLCDLSGTSDSYFTSQDEFESQRKLLDEVADKKLKLLESSTSTEKQIADSTEPEEETPEYNFVINDSNSTNNDNW